MKQKDEIKRELFQKLTDEHCFWSYDMTGVEMIPDDMLILKTLIHLDMDEIDLLFQLWPKKKIKRVWREQMVTQGDYYRTLNLFLAWWYFDVKMPARYLQTIETKRLNLTL